MSELTVATTVLAQGYGRHMDWDGSGPSGWMVAWMAILGTVLVALLVFGVVMVVRAGRPAESPPAANRARDVLDERYARGEIDTAEYEERRRLLG